ncbi:uncharacterized protein JCM6883_003323 [Sporobolomyces salmoneus]|uniref:uncharacterized protein n=1 Tax=Sporobolomyces salmoneus TaxID=183962 RepID=UPI00318294E9
MSSPSSSSLDPFPPRPQPRPTQDSYLLDPSHPHSHSHSQSHFHSSPDSNQAQLSSPSSSYTAPSLASSSEYLPPLSSSSQTNTNQHDLPQIPLVSPDLAATTAGAASSNTSSFVTSPQSDQFSTSNHSFEYSIEFSTAPPQASTSTSNGGNYGVGNGTGGNGIGIGIAPPRTSSSSNQSHGGGGYLPSTPGDEYSSSLPSPAPAPPPLHQQQQSMNTANAVPVEFDEGVLRALCDSDCGLPLLLDRLKQSMTSCRETSTFLKKRAQIEEEYARSMSKLVKSSVESYGLGDGKAGSFVNSYLSLLKTHDHLSSNRLKFSTQLSEMSEELSTLSREIEKVRKTSKEMGGRLERGLNEQEGLVEKARTRFDSAAEELERLLLLKSGESLATTAIPHASPSSSSSSSSHPSGSSGSKGRSLMSKLKGPKNPAQVAKQEEEMRSRMGQASDSYRASVQGAQSVKQEYFNLQLPKLLRTLKESSDEIDLGTQYHLSRYAYLFESLLVTDGLTISPVSSEDGPGVKTVIESIDTREDFKSYMQQYVLNWQISGQKGPKRDGATPGIASSNDSTYVSRPPLSPRSSFSQTPSSSLPPPTSNPTFGVDLGDQMLRDSVEVPRILEKCCEAIEREGLESMGIYRLSGTTSRVQRLKASLDRDLEGTDLLSEENLSDINDIAAVLKLWFRELPEPLLTWELYHQFIDVAKIENDRLRHIRLHERVNELPDPNYATLKYLMGHLDKVAQQESSNQMSVSNLAIVFGPNLLSPPPPHLAHHFPPPPPPQPSQSSASSTTTNGTTTEGGGGNLADTQWKCKCVETILAHYKEIFVE